MLHIIKATDPITVSTLTLMIVGEPGVGKSSTAFTADKTLLFDFDAGAHRARNRRDSVKVSQWEDVARLDPQDFADYNTICVDTAGRCLDCITTYIIRTQPKLARSSGALSLQGFGELKAVFTSWIKQLRALGKDVVLLAHDSEEKNGDDIKIRPDIQGGSRNEIIKVADMVGMLYQGEKNRILDFSPTEKWLGKNCADLPPLIVPNFAGSPDFLAKVIADSKAAINQQSAEALGAQAILDDWAKAIKLVVTLEDANAGLAAMNGGNLGSQLRTVKGLMLTRTRELGFVFDDKAKAFKLAPPAIVAAA